MALTKFTSGTGIASSPMNANFIASGKILEVYTGTDLNNSTNATTTTREFTFTSSELGNADYVEISFFGNFYAQKSVSSGNSPTANVSCKIESKHIGGSYSDSMGNRTIVNPTSVRNDDDSSSERVRSFSWIHTLSSNEKTNGVTFKISITVNRTSGSGASSSASFINSQITFSNRV